MLVFSFALSTLPPARFPDLIQISLLYRSPAFDDFPLPNFTFTEVLLLMTFLSRILLLRYFFLLALYMARCYVPVLGV